MQIHSVWQRRFFTFGTLLVLSGCGDGEDNSSIVPLLWRGEIFATENNFDEDLPKSSGVAAKIIKITMPKVIEPTINTTVELHANGFYDDGFKSDITRVAEWTSSDIRVASVTRGGLLTAHKAGTVIITASFGEVQAQQEIIVQPENLSPLISGDIRQASSSLPFHFTPDIIDPEGQSVVLIGENLPGWLTLDGLKKTVYGTPGKDDVGEHEIVLVASDGVNKTRKKWTVIVENGEKYDAINAHDFYELDNDNKHRNLSNDLQGNLAANVQFVQSHSIKANNNAHQDKDNELNSRYMPDLVPERSALMLVIPEKNVSGMILKVQNDGVETLRLPFKHPSELIRSDYNAKDGRPDVIYSSKAWSLELPWHVVKPGMSLTVVSDPDTKSELTGELTSFDFAAPAELLLRSIQLGMLTEPPSSVRHHMLNNPEEAGSDYFQTIPVAKLTVVSYLPMKLDKVIVANGTIYDSVSSTTGSVYSGDMRENVAKSQVGTGINLANLGINSNNMLQQYPHGFKQITIHHAAGNYLNGSVSHGLSGGNGIATLYQTYGNEHSHELGHAFGLGHWPGAELTTDRKWAAHHADSGWGYIAHRQRMRANIHWMWAPSGASINGITSPYVYKGLYSYNRDAMSSGEVTSPKNISVYTHHTGYSAYKIQKNIDMPIPDLAYQSGYKQWDHNLQKFVDAKNLGDVRIRKPSSIGQQVTTLLGGYDPKTGVALIYPPFEGNYGNIFEPLEPEGNGNACWLQVNNVEGKILKFSLSAVRHNNKSINQFHVNLPASYLPTEAQVYCRKNGIETELTRTSFSGVRPEMPNAVIVGKEFGYSALKEKELPLIEAELTALKDEMLPTPSQQLSLWLTSYGADNLLDEVNGVAYDVLSRIVQQTQLVTSVKRLLTRWQLEQKNEEEKKNIITWLREKKLVDVSDKIIPPSGLLVRATNSSVCMIGAIGGGVTVSNQCSSGDTALQWFVDANGGIHPSENPDQCLTPGAGDRLTLSDCKPGQVTQRWTYDNGRIKNIGNNKCIDHGKGTVIMYGCHTNPNQQWLAPTESSHVFLASLDGVSMRALFTLLN
ncbi:M66 family metalloprotease [Aeromonas hydrophila]|uniref:M66 family metalloprotease n=1 Tax=Aeromonas hydrophila TaxID=644 RepID=UPI0009B81245|nr:M66 family metalloprotease [Aeromonas hydrophila]